MNGKGYEIVEYIYFPKQQFERFYYKEKEVQYGKLP
jgi:hypothetical protein